MLLFSAQSIPRDVYRGYVTLTDTAFIGKSLFQRQFISITTSTSYCSQRHNVQRRFSYTHITFVVMALVLRTLRLLHQVVDPQRVRTINSQSSSAMNASWARSSTAYSQTRL